VLPHREPSVDVIRIGSLEIGMGELKRIDDGEYFKTP
jgi:hypothetical protein